jgi:hypothetical protein
MSVNLVQTASITKNTSTSVVLNFPSVTKAGNLLVMIATTYSMPGGMSQYVTGVSDSGYNNWNAVQQQFAKDTHSPSGTGSICLWAVGNANPVSSIVVNTIPTSLLQSVFIYEFSGIQPTPLPIDISTIGANSLGAKIHTTDVGRLILGGALATYSGIISGAQSPATGMHVGVAGSYTLKGTNYHNYVGDGYYQSGTSGDNLLYFSGVSGTNPASIQSIVVAFIQQNEGVEVLTLAEILTVTSPNPGNFSTAHGLNTTPALIEVIPTSSGAFWAQNPAYDGTNINLVASDEGLTALVAVYVSSFSSDVTVPITSLSVTSPDPGNFTVAHNLGVTPSLIEILPTSSGAIWAQTQVYDDTLIYLSASDIGVTAEVSVFPPASPLNIAIPATTLFVDSPAGGNFTVTHGLGNVPSRIEILSTSNGAMWAQTPAFDGTYIYLVASDEAVTAQISVYA